MAPKDKDKRYQKGGVIYRLKCPHINCPEEYIGESGRSLGERLKEHLRAPSHIHHHSDRAPGQPQMPHHFGQGVTRDIKEAMYIHVNDSSLNRNLGNYQLPHIWDEVLRDTPSFQLN